VLDQVFYMYNQGTYAVGVRRTPPGSTFPGSPVLTANVDSQALVEQFVNYTYLVPNIPFRIVPTNMYDSINYNKNVLLLVDASSYEPLSSSNIWFDDPAYEPFFGNS